MIARLIESVIKSKATAALFVILYTLALLGTLKLNDHDFRLFAAEKIILDRAAKIEKIEALDKWMARHEERELILQQRIGEMGQDVKLLLARSARGERDRNR
jgi:hypothetical protein